MLAVHTKTQFHAIVNGMDGDVAPQSVGAQFGRTSVVSQGEVAKKAGSGGETVSLGATEMQGQIQDWFHLLSKADRPASNRGDKLQSAGPSSPREERLHRTGEPRGRLWNRRGASRPPGDAGEGCPTGSLKI
jgi:hypothetical protein